MATTNEPSAATGDADPRAARRAALVWGALAVLLLGTELACHLWPRPWAYTRGWNVAHRDSGPYAPVDVPGPFFPSVRYEGPCFGDLAFLARVPILRATRPQVFSTDAWGFRNPPERATDPWLAVAFGDSMMVGSGISDDQTLPARLSELVGGAVYDAAGLDASIVLADERWLATPPRFVLVESVERFLVYDASMERLSKLVPGSLASGSPAPGPPPPLVRGRWSRAHSAATHFGGLAWSAARFALFDELASDEVVLGTDGRTLFSTEELVHAALPPALARVERVAEAIEACHRAFAGHGITLVYLLCPDKTTLRRELVPPALRRSLRPPGELVEALQAELERRGVPYVDLLATFRSVLAEDPGAELWWPDDTHWTPRGADVAARATARRLSLLDGSDG